MIMFSKNKTAFLSLILAGMFVGLAVVQAPAQQPAPQAPAQTAAQEPALVGNLNLQDASLTEVVDQLARQLKINIQVDPRVKGTVTLNTYGETRNLDARNLLEMILRVNGFGMVQEGEIYRVVPLTDAIRQPLPFQVNGKDIPADDQLMLNLVFLKYVGVDELSKVLQEFTDTNAVVKVYPPANLLFILDSRRNMRRLMELVALFDSDTFVGERVRLYEIHNARPSDLVKELENILKSISLDTKSSTVRFLPVDRIGTLIAVAPNSGAFETVEVWIKKLDIQISATSGVIDTYVYHVRYGRADCLAMALNQLYMPSSGYGGGYAAGYPGGNYGGGYGGAYGNSAYGGGAYGGGAYGGGFPGGANIGGGGYGSQNSFNSGFGGAGACGSFGGMGGGNSYGGGGYGYPSFGGYAAQAPVVPNAGPLGLAPAAAGPAPAGGAAAVAQSAASDNANPPRIVPNPLDNSLLIQADAQQYQAILKLLKELDVAPRQILLEAKIYSVAMTGSFAMGVNYYYQKVSGQERKPMASLVNAVTTLSAGTLVGQAKELLAFLSLQDNAGNARVISEPSLIATDSIPASINVGTQVPVLTGTIITPGGGTNTQSQGISSHNTGVTLQVNARVNPSGVVTLIINQEVSKPTSTNTSNIQTPSFDQQVVQTQITMQDGDTIAIGGIISENTTSGSSGVPGLNRIPVVGGIFGSKTYSRDRSELILFMTPHVIYDTNDLLEASQELKARVKKLRKYVKE
ncbi:MAG TPA: type II secretion system secretin GspD [Bryobacteraceae bacterium]|nr:type II secretion system secretin GspD [Bryobacteraceae bacterium]